MAAAQDVPVQAPPTDTVQALRWSPTSNHLATGSWDNQVRVWDVQQTGQAVPQVMLQHDAPVLDIRFSADGRQIFSGSCDSTVSVWDLATKQRRVIGRHTAPVRCVGVLPENGLVVSGSWDSTVQYWDLRQPQPTLSVKVPDRVYAMDATAPLLVVGCANRHMQIFHLAKPNVPFRSFTSPLKMQTRCLANFPNKQGFAVGSIEGRVAIHMVEEKSPANFAFKCHRQQSEVYALNNISFHPSGTFATAGSDGVFTYWNKDTKQRLKQFPRQDMPITAAEFNRDGSIYAYACGYDWSKGAQYYDKSRPPRVMLHQVRRDEMLSEKNGRR